MRPRTLLTIVLLAALSFGGSFTCSGSSHDDHKTTTVTVN